MVCILLLQPKIEMPVPHPKPQRPVIAASTAALEEQWLQDLTEQGPNLSISSHHRTLHRLVLFSLPFQLPECRKRCCQSSKCHILLEIISLGKDSNI